MVDKVTINDDALNTTASTASTTQSTTSEASERPSWLPEKFNTAEDMASAYAELEKKMSSGQPEEQPTQEQVEQATGLSLDPYYNEYAENGTLSDDSYQKLEASGLNRELVDSYIQGQQALADATVQSIYQAAGGQEKYTALTDWASKNLSDAEQENFNEIMEKGSVEAATFAVKGLRAQYDAQFGIQPSLMQGQNANQNSDVFRSTAEVIQAINDPKYQNDTHYRSTVEAKIKRSNVM
tara:strand:+ start:303 stop:1019 length:717 start_codon:yes stop_codon:yes gene_type:complete